MEGTARINEGVIHPRRIAPDRHEPRASEVSQVTGHRGLREPKHRDQVADADLAFREEMKHSKPRAIGQRTKQSIDGRYGTL